MYAAPAATEVPPGAMYAAPAATEGAPMMYAAPLGEGSEGQPAPAPMLGQTIMGNTYQADLYSWRDAAPMQEHEQLVPCRM